MGNLTISKDKILSGFVAPFVKLLAFALSFIDNKELVAEVVDDAAAQINALKEQVATPPTMEEALAAVFDIAETSCALTPTKVDDAVIQTAKSLFAGGGLIGAIQGLIHLGKAHREDKKAAANAVENSSETPAVEETKAPE